MVEMMGTMSTKMGSGRMKPDMGKKKGKGKMTDGGMMECPMRSMAPGKSKKGK